VYLKHSYSHNISTHLLACYFVCIVISSRLVSSHLISSHLISSYLISSYLISSHLISSHLISSHLVSSYLLTTVCRASQEEAGQGHLQSLILGLRNFIVTDKSGCIYQHKENVQQEHPEGKLKHKCHVKQQPTTNNQQPTTNNQQPTTTGASSSKINYANIAIYLIERILLDVYVETLTALVLLEWEWFKVVTTTFTTWGNYFFFFLRRRWMSVGCR
jgi:hypothetical protein